MLITFKNECGRVRTIWDNRPWVEWCYPLSLKLKLFLTEAAVKVGTTCLVPESPVTDVAQQPSLSPLPPSPTLNHTHMHLQLRYKYKHKHLVPSLRVLRPINTERMSLPKLAAFTASILLAAQCRR